MRRLVFKGLIAATFGLCLIVPILFFLGKLSLGGFRTIFLAASLGYLLSAALLSRRARA